MTKPLTLRQVTLLGKLTSEFGPIDGRSRLNAEGLVLLGLALAKKAGKDETGEDTFIYKISAAGTKALGKAALVAPAPEKKARSAKAKAQPEAEA